MSEKCPKCGAEVFTKTNGEVNTYITFKCGTSRLNDEDHRQSQDCRIAELEKEVERLREKRGRKRAIELTDEQAAYLYMILDSDTSCENPRVRRAAGNVLRKIIKTLELKPFNPIAFLEGTSATCRASALLKGEKEGEGK